MPTRDPIISRRTRRKLFVATGALSLALWLVLTVAEGYPPLHAWLHGGKIPDNDDCAIVMIHHGKVDTTPVSVNVFVTLVLPFAGALSPVPVFAPVHYSLLPGRAPPAFFA
jgi:hypothetical protein